MSSRIERKEKVLDLIFEDYTKTDIVSITLDTPEDKEQFVDWVLEHRLFTNVDGKEFSNKVFSAIKENKLPSTLSMTFSFNLSRNDMRLKLGIADEKVTYPRMVRMENATWGTSLARDFSAING